MQDEFDAALTALRGRSRAVITGPAGSGRTSLLHSYALDAKGPVLLIVPDRAAALRRTDWRGRASWPAAIGKAAARAIGIAPADRGPFGTDAASALSLDFMDGFRPSLWGRWALDAVTAFCRSTDARIQPHHLPPLPDGGRRAEQVLAWAERIWKLMGLRSGGMPPSTMACLKLWALRGGSAPRGYAAVAADDAQDLPPVLVEILGRIALPVVLAADPSARLQLQDPGLGPTSVALMRSLRLGPGCRPMLDPLMRRMGAGCFDMAGNARPGQADDEAVTVITRTEAAILDASLGARRVHIVGGADRTARLLAGIWRIAAGERSPDVPLLARFRSMAELEEASDTGCAEAAAAVAVVRKHGSQLPLLVAELTRRQVEPEAAERTIATVSTCRDLAFQRVRLWDDFPTPAALAVLAEPFRQREFRLLYLAAGRSEVLLGSNRALAAISRAASRAAA